jgi:hypothetical protein
MKKFLFLMIAAVFAFEGFAQEATAKKVDGPIITFEKKSHDFGDMTQGDKVEEVFKFTNTGNEPLIITNVEVTCGCTTPKGWQRDPIPPGGKSEIVVAFNSTGKLGRVNKTVKVVSNAANPEGTIISFTANVLDKGAANPQ